MKQPYDIRLKKQILPPFGLWFVVFVHRLIISHLLLKSKGRFTSLSLPLRLLPFTPSLYKDRQQPERSTRVRSAKGVLGGALIPCLIQHLIPA